MSEDKNVSEERKKEIMELLWSYQYHSFLLLALTPKFFQQFKSLMEEYILPRIQNETDEGIYTLFYGKYHWWKEKINEENKKKCRELEFIKGVASFENALSDPNSSVCINRYSILSEEENASLSQILKKLKKRDRTPNFPYGIERKDMHIEEKTKDDA